MKISIALLFLVCLLICRSFAQTNYPINSNSTIKWTGHAEVGTYAPSGTLNFIDGSVTTNGKIITSAVLTVDMKSMKQENEHLLEHLKSDDFFDVEKYPVSIIKIDKVVNGIAYGKLTIKNKTLPFQYPVIVEIKSTFTTITGKAVVDRTKFGIIYNSGNFFSGLGDKAIKNTFEVEFHISVKLAN